jgi:hypothetical protein
MNPTNRVLSAIRDLDPWLSGRGWSARALEQIHGKTARSHHDADRPLVRSLGGSSARPISVPAREGRQTWPE